ncbi:alpha/beta fold hydrolase [Actinoallomurus soli]|uniref:alpha/beta fold hydrolase n=1 Tax=Actinoallomurus soli TaxID=2952535 RepID=UPI00209355D8|nr:alpha/beta fold hydrolase [Actinoallomurus soli]MCO5968332.1 alpha/beta fold hydrolase [Actinoallomurus soli]
MIGAHETFDGTFPFPPHFSTAPGFRMHYVDEGAGPVLLCLHGEPTWGYLFRHLITEFSGAHRVVVPDHMGFGKSETPADRTYWLQDHIDNLEALVLDLRLRDITLVMHDFGGPVGMGLLSRHPELISRVVGVNGPTPFGQPELGAVLAANASQAPWFQWIMRAQEDGTLDDVLGALGYNILSTLKLNGFQDGTIITPTWIRAYAAAFPTRAETLGALGWAKGFALGAHVFEPPTAGARELLATIPALAIWGAEDRTLDGARFLPLFRAAFPHGLVSELPGVGHYSLEDAPRTISALLRLFLDATDRSASIAA